MVPVSPRVVRAAALGVIVVATACTASILQTSKPVSGPDTQELRRRAAGLHDLLLPAAVPLPADDNTPTTAVPVVHPPVAPRKPVARASAARTVSAPAPRTHRGEREPRQRSSQTEVPAPPALPVGNPLSQLALVGVTNEGGSDTAWLVDLKSNERQPVGQGGSILDFTVKEINPESVVLTRGTENYTLALGEKPVLLASAAGLDGISLGGEDDSESAGPRGGRGPRGGPGGFGGGGRFGAGGFAGAGGGRGFPGGGGFGGGGFSGAALGASSNNGFGGGGGGGFNRSGRTGGGGFGGGGFGGGTNSGGGSQFSASATGSTSNPQTARRRGTSLIGGGTAMAAPAAISNPQTERRKGTTSTGSTPAFGTGDGTTAAAGNSSRRSGAAATR